MKVSSIAPYKCQKTPAFNGLWGDPKVDSSISTDSVYTRIQEFYYPFKNEYEPDIKKAIENRTDSFIVRADETLGDSITVLSTVAVMESLPFTKEEYQNYKKGKYNDAANTEKRLLIESSLEVNKLLKHKNSLIADKNSNRGVVSFFKRIFKK